MEDEEALLQPSVNPDVQVEFEDEIQDWRNLSKVKDTALPKRGEKDYEPDGTTYQEKILQESRDSMFEALAGERGHVIKQHIKATWIPSVKKAVIEKAKGSFVLTCGTGDAQNRCWLRPEEFCYLAERGTIEPYFESKDVPMSISAVYASCFQNEDEIDDYHVYAYLKRHGFIVMRYEPSAVESSKIQTQDTFALFKNIFRMITNSGIFKFFNKLHNVLSSSSYPSFHPLHFSTTKYTNYSQIYNSIKLIPYFSLSPRPSPTTNTTNTTHTNPPIAFNVWKPDPRFSKKSPPLPHFQVIVRNVNKYNFPTLSQLRSCFETTRIQDQDVPEPNQAKRLKNGYRYILVATIDYGIINFVKISEADFGNEDVWYVPSPKGSGPVQKKGGKNK